VTVNWAKDFENKAEKETTGSANWRRFRDEKDLRDALVGWKLVPEHLGPRPRGEVLSPDLNPTLHPAFVEARKWVFQLSLVALQELAKLYGVSLNDLRFKKIDHTHFLKALATEARKIDAAAAQAARLEKKAARAKSRDEQVLLDAQSREVAALQAAQDDIVDAISTEKRTLSAELAEVVGDDDDAPPSAAERNVKARMREVKNKLMMAEAERAKLLGELRKKHKAQLAEAEVERDARRDYKRARQQQRTAAPPTPDTTTPPAPAPTPAAAAPAPAPSPAPAPAPAAEAAFAPAVTPSPAATITAVAPNMVPAGAATAGLLSAFTWGDD
jgi:hypothetical protein